MYRRYYFLIINLFILNHCFSQIDSFNLRDFVLPEVKIKSLTIDGDAAGNTKSVQQTNNQQQSNFRARINLRYRNFYNSPELQKEQYSGLLSQYNILNHSTSNPNAQYTNFYSSNTLFINTNDRFYFKPKKFWGLGGAFFTTYSHNKSTSSTDPGIAHESKIATVSISPKIQIGFGRIETVTSAWKTLRILKDFEAFGLLSHSPSNEEILQLAQTIAQQEYNRVFDSRLGTIRRIEAIDRQIQNSHLINSAESTYFTLLYDSYLYGIQTSRKAGNRLTFEIQPNVELRLKPAQLTTNLSSSIAYESFNPVNQYWQIDFALQLITKTSEINTASRSFNLGVKTYLSTAYYPNSRTSFSANIAFNKAITGGFSDIFPLHPFSLGTKINYYLSPRTRLTAYFSVNKFTGYLLATTAFPDQTNSHDELKYGLMLKHAIF